MDFSHERGLSENAAIEKQRILAGPEGKDYAAAGDIYVVLFGGDEAIGLQLCPKLLMPSGVINKAGAELTFRHWSGFD